MLKHGDLFDELPDKYRDSAFLDRLYYYVPGWEVEIIRGEMFSEGYGFVVDYLAEVLRSFRDHDYSDRIAKFFDLSPDISTRDRDAIRKTFSGLMKIIHPGGEASKEEMEEILRFSLEGRKRVKDQMIRIDSTFPPVNFSYTDIASGKEHSVTTLEEREYPRHYYQNVDLGEELPDPQDREEGLATSQQADTEKPLEAKHITIEEGQRGISYDDLFGPYLRGAKEIQVTDPYIRAFFQIRNFMEFLETVNRFKEPEDEVNVHLTTAPDDYHDTQQSTNLDQVIENVRQTGINFTWEYDVKGTIHARHITTDTGWKILLDRGLDIFQRFESNDQLAIANRMQEYRQCKEFEVTYIRDSE